YGAIAVVAIVIVDGPGERVGCTDERSADSLLHVRLQGLVGQVAEWLILVEVRRQEGGELAARIASVRGRAIDVDTHHLVDGVGADVARFGRESRGEFTLEEEIPALNVSPVHVLGERGGNVGGWQIRGRRGNGGRGELAGADIRRR